MASKKPRRTAERILEVTLALFNRFGEPNVSTTLISAELGISPGNLYYHYASKDVLINALFSQHEQALEELLSAADGVRHVEDAWLFVHMMFELIWQHRFLYRDLNDLLSKNRHLEMQVQRLLANKARALRAVLDGVAQGEAGARAPHDADALATTMAVVLTYWLSYEYARDPRHALEPEAAGLALARGCYHTLGLLMPYLDVRASAHLRELAAGYLIPSPAETTA